MKKIEIIFKLSEKSRKSYKLERFYENGITKETIDNIIDTICTEFFIENPVILSLREISYNKSQIKTIPMIAICNCDKCKFIRSIYKE